jgi:hypothetical protein
MRELGTAAKLQLIPAIGYPCTNADLGQIMALPILAIFASHMN